MSTNPAHEYDEPMQSYGGISYAQSVRMRCENAQLLKILEVKRKEEGHAEKQLERRVAERRANYEQQMRTFDEKRSKNVTQVVPKLPDTDQIKVIDTQEVKTIRIHPPVVLAFKQEIERTIGIYRNERGYLPGYIAMSPRNRIWIRKHFPDQLRDCYQLRTAGVEIAYYVDDDLDDLSFYCM